MKSGLRILFSSRASVNRTRSSRSFATGETIPSLDLDSPDLQRVFDELYHSIQRPVIIRGGANPWRARNGNQKWTWEFLQRKYGGFEFRVGVGQNGEVIERSLADFITKVILPSEGLPEPVSKDYLFDELFVESCPEMQQDYTWPPWIPADLFEQLLGSDHPARPDYRWLVVAPKGSGLGLHTDPLLTEAWHGLVIGRKRWIMYPPAADSTTTTTTTTNYAIRRDHGQQQQQQHEHPQQSQQRYRGSNSQPQRQIDDNNGDYYEVVQEAGDIVYLPSGWPHSVWNERGSVAITHNFASRYSWPIVKKEVERGGGSEELQAALAQAAHVL